MLESLHIRNLALVTELDMEFGSGLNTVTGETGAGKSLIIGAIQLLAGGRAAPGLIRKGAHACEVAGVIALDERYGKLREETDLRLEVAGIAPCEEGRLLLRRVITESGSRAYVNGSMVTAGFLKELCETMVDLHGPHDNQTLLSSAMQLKLLDSYAGCAQELGSVKSIYQELSKIRRQRQELKSEGLTPEESDLLAHQLKEIEHAALKPGEEEGLVQVYRRSSHSQRLKELAYQAQNTLCGDEGSLTELLGGQLRQLRELETLDPEGSKPLVEHLESIWESLREAGFELGEYAETMEVDQEELQRICQRLDLIQKLKRKYGPSLEEVIACGQRLKDRLERIRNMAGMLQQLDQQEKACGARLQESCAVLHGKRLEAAGRLEKEITAKLKGLGFAKSMFSIPLAAAEPGPCGADAVEYLFAPNVGEEPQPLRQVASSGEVARVMLAIKAVLSDADSVPVLIFDEIDANVGGRVAVSVAQELRNVAYRHQVFSITHLPQIAAAGAQHYLVAKYIENERTQTAMHRLDGQERLQELVRMLGADENSANAVAHAKDLLKGFEK